MPRKKDPKATKKRILSAAETLFAEKGYYGTTTRKIANDAGVSIQTLHYHFNDKQSLYYAVQKRAFEPFREIINRYIDEMLKSETIDDELMAHFHGKIADEMFDLYNKFPNYARLVFRQWLQQDGDLAQTEGEQGIQDLIRWSEITKGLVTGEDDRRMHRIDPRLVMVFITWIYAGLHINPVFTSKLLGAHKDTEEHSVFLKTQIRLATRLLLGIDAE